MAVKKTKTPTKEVTEAPVAAPVVAEETTPTPVEEVSTVTETVKDAAEVATATPVVEEAKATDPLDGVRMTLEQFLMHIKQPMTGIGFVVGVLNRAAGIYPRPLRDWKVAYTKHIGELE